MPKHTQADNTPHTTATAAPVTSLAPVNLPSEEKSTLGEKALAVAAVGVAAALIEVEWIPGVLLGVGAMLAPNLLPKIGNGLRPLVKGAVRAGYSVASKTRETMAEAGEQFQDIVAEVKAEDGFTAAGTSGHTSTATTTPSGETA